MRNHTPRTYSHTVPLDVLLDVLKIFLDNDIAYHIEGINERENTLLIQVQTDTGLSRHRKAVQNLKSMLDDYGHFRYSSENASQSR